MDASSRNAACYESCDDDGHNNDNARPANLSEGISFLERAGFAEYRRLKYRDLVEATGNFSPKNKIGEGSSGVVYKGILMIHAGLQAEVAVKRMFASENDEFLGELMATSQTSHRNIVMLKGWCYHRKPFDFIRKQRNGCPFLVYELVPNGTLYDHLYEKKPRNTVLPWATRYEIVKGIASGVCYLHHQCKSYILHRNIKPSSILLDNDFNPKLAGFGISLITHHKNTIPPTHAIGTVRYMDPLCMKDGKVKYTRASDVYSFGVVLLDIACTGKTSELVREKYRSRTSLEKFLGDAADVELHGAFDRMQMKQVVVLGLWCSFLDDAQRPSMEEVIKVLGNDAPLLKKGMRILQHEVA